MVYYIVIRQADKKDSASQKQLFYCTVMSYCNSAFLMFLFKELTLQMTVLVSAIMFIFIGVPLNWCIMAIPLVGVVVYTMTYATHAFKAAEKIELRPLNSWVAEAYEPYYLNANPASLKYLVIDSREAEIQQCDWEQNMRKKIVGTVSVADFRGPNNSIWLYGLAVDYRYRRRGIAKKLTNAVIDYCHSEKFESVELVTNDLQGEARQLFQKLGFVIRQIYHKQLIGTMLTIGMFHQGFIVNEFNR